MHNKSSDTDLDKIINRVKTHLAKRNKIELGSITLELVEQVTWPDTSLGSPRAGRVYAAILTEGYRLILFDGYSDYEYHTDSKQRFVLHCINNHYNNIQDGGAP